MKREIEQDYIDHYRQRPAWIVRSPGRVNLIGGHTDYNDGFVLPMAIERAIWIALSPVKSRDVQLYSVDFKQHAKMSLDDLRPGNRAWFEYVKGMAWVLQQMGYTLAGWKGVVVGDIPIGAGLSSSAALELASARAFAAAAGFEWEPVEMAKAGQRAENKWIGVNCGIMDQMISATGKSNHALLIDCRSLEITPVKLPKETSVVIMDTNTRRKLVDSAYNERQSQCEQAAQAFGVSSLRDITLDTLEASKDSTDPLLYRRARHVISENSRVLRAAEAMGRGDATKVGEIMNASHISLRDDFEVSSRELDIMVSVAQEQPECYGAHMTGAGFGGCAVALVAEADSFVNRVGQRYKEQTGLEPSIYVCRAEGGTELLGLRDGGMI